MSPEQMHRHMRRKEMKKKHLIGIQLIKHKKSDRLKSIAAKYSNGKVKRYKPKDKMPPNVFRMLPEVLRKQLSRLKDLDEEERKLEEIKYEIDQGIKSINFGEDMRSIPVQKSGRMIFANEKGRDTYLVHSSHEYVLSNSNWKLDHLNMIDDFEDPYFDLEDRETCLFGQYYGGAHKMKKDNKKV